MLHAREPLESVSAHGSLPVDCAHRYRVAAALLDGERVVHLYCGDGRGSLLLATSCHVVGVDGDAAAVDMARATLPASLTAEYHAADPVAWLRSAPDQPSAIVMLDPPPAEDAACVHDTLRRLAVDGRPVIVALAREAERHELAAWTALPVRALRQHRLEGSMLIEEDAWPREGRAVFHGEPPAEPPAVVMLLANIDEGDREPNVLHLLPFVAACGEPSELARLQHANAELRRTNQRLGREQLGRFGSAAARQIVPAQQPSAVAGTQLVEEEHRALQLWATELEQRLQLLEAEYESMRSTRTWRLATSWWRLRARVRG